MVVATRGRLVHPLAADQCQKAPLQACSGLYWKT